MVPSFSHTDKLTTLPVNVQASFARDEDVPVSSSDDASPDDTNAVRADSALAILGTASR